MKELRVFNLLSLIESFRSSSLNPTTHPPPTSRCKKEKRRRGKEDIVLNGWGFDNLSMHRIGIKNREREGGHNQFE